MARIDWIEQRLQNWARWRLTSGSGALGFASVNLEQANMPREPYAEAPIPTSGIEAGETDDAVARLPSELRATVECHYLGRGTQAEKLARLCCTRATLYARVERAHHLLAEHFLAKQAKQKAERERVERLQLGVRPG